MTKNLIAYFSSRGRTKKVAEKINNLIDADIFEIEAKVAYTDADLDWTNKVSRSSVEMADKSSRPEIKSGVDVSDYDTIYLGFPVWWYTAPTLINTFIEESNIKNKTIYVFVTSGSTGVKQSVMDLNKTYPDNTWKEGIRLTGTESDERILDWIKQ